MKSKCLELILAGALFLTPTTRAETNTIHSNTQPTLIEKSQKTELELAKEGKIDRQEYLTKQYNKLKISQDLNSKGIVLGILYNPSEEELRAKFREISQTNTNEVFTKEKEDLAVKRSLLTKDRLGCATIYPSITQDIGKKLPCYLIFWDQFFKEPYIKNDADVRSIERHEGFHALINYWGMFIRNKTKDQPSVYYIENEVIATELMELGALHYQIKCFYDNGREIEGPSRELKNEVFSNYAAIYSYLYNYLNTDATASEKEGIIAQLRKFDDIVPVMQKDGSLGFHNLREQKR
jgi:hypothetical protein